MPGVVADTHAIVWYLSSDARLSPRAADAFDSAAAAGEPIFVPSICLVELSYLVEKGRLPATARERLIQAIDDPSMPFAVSPLDRAVADAVQQIDRSDVPDLPDRIVAATAVALEVSLVSRDRKIRASRLQTIW